MRVRWFAFSTLVANAARTTIRSPLIGGPWLVRGGSWGGLTTGGNCSLEFGYCQDNAGTQGNGSGVILETNAALATPKPFTPFDVQRLTMSSAIDGFAEFGAATGPANYRPLHLVCASRACLALAIWNNTGGGITVGGNIEIVEEVPQAWLDCLRHLVA